MIRKRFVKALVLTLAWIIFLTILIINWSSLKSVRWLDVTETVKISGIGDFIVSNSGAIFFFWLIAIFILYWIKMPFRIGKRLPAEASERLTFDESKDELEVFENLKGQNDRYCSPAHRYLSCNIFNDTKNSNTNNLM